MPFAKDVLTTGEVAKICNVAPRTVSKWFDSGQLQKLGLPVGNEFTVTYHPTSGDNTWKNDLTQINGARFVQFRVTFLANAESGLTPELSALGFAFSK